MFNMKILAGLVAVAALGACVEEDEFASSTPAVGSSADLSSFEGAKAGQAEMGIQNLGYEAVRSQGLTTWWFNRSTGACARIVTSNGRYSEVDMLPAGDC
ncbi:hypothetical protein PAF17_19815 [Paracoccus sp. Z330]|uniref:Uncharacterized protein n=1 Tax=Paracoccus onchidii TaxID=3017813 RepID=A0ABT4ZJZ9_9RHOB|nr:hypothetical protein [Paracoccus onchidii]MDB6179698.1 hypothetical protein [Paracoccus onchidii]